MNITIRPIESMDLDVLLEFAPKTEERWRDTIVSLIPRLNYLADCERCLVAVDDLEEIIGLLYCFILPNGVMMPELIYVREEYRGLSIGSQLLDAAEKLDGCFMVQVFHHSELRDFYRKHGYIWGENLEVSMKIVKT